MRERSLAYSGGDGDGETVSAFSLTPARSRLRFFFSPFSGDSVGAGEVIGVAVALWPGDASALRVSAFPD